MGARPTDVALTTLGNDAGAPVQRYGVFLSDKRRLSPSSKRLPGQAAKSSRCSGEVFSDFVADRTLLSA